jgi:hypothetical protein
MTYSEKHGRRAACLGCGETTSGENDGAPMCRRCCNDADTELFVRDLQEQVAQLIRRAEKAEAKLRECPTGPYNVHRDSFAETADRDRAVLAWASLAGLDLWAVFAPDGSCALVGQEAPARRIAAALNSTDALRERAEKAEALLREYRGTPSMPIKVGDCVHFDDVPIGATYSFLGVEDVRREGVTPSHLSIFPDYLIVSLPGRPTSFAGESATAGLKVGDRVRFKDIPLRATYMFVGDPLRRVKTRTAGGAVAPDGYLLGASDHTNEADYVIVSLPPTGS